MSNTPLPIPRKNILITAAAAAVVIAAAIFTIWKYSQADTVNAGNTAFAKYIEGYTTGVISREGTVRVRLATQVNTLHQPNQEESRKLFDLSPSVKGKTY